jgi:hypothetical protein
VDANAEASLSSTVQLPDWAFQATIHRPTDKNESVLLFKRVSVDRPAPSDKPAATIHRP